MIECLKDSKKHLTQRCHQKVFKLQENEMMDPELDFQLMRVCKQMIRVSKEDTYPSKFLCIYLSVCIVNFL